MNYSHENNPCRKGVRLSAVLSRLSAGDKSGIGMVRARDISARMYDDTYMMSAAAKVMDAYFRTVADAVAREEGGRSILEEAASGDPNSLEHLETLAIADMMRRGQALLLNASMLGGKERHVCTTITPEGASFEEMYEWLAAEHRRVSAEDRLPDWSEDEAACLHHIIQVQVAKEVTNPATDSEPRHVTTYENVTEEDISKALKSPPDIEVLEVNEDADEDAGPLARAARCSINDVDEEGTRLVMIATIVMNDGRVASLAAPYWPIPVLWGMEKMPGAYRWMCEQPGSEANATLTSPALPSEALVAAYLLHPKTKRPRGAAMSDEEFKDLADELDRQEGGENLFDISGWSAEGWSGGDKDA